MPSDDGGFAFSSRVFHKASKIKAPYKSRNYQFIDAMRWLASAQDDEPLPALVVNPHRPNRYEPRVRKRRPKPYPLMTKPRHQLRNLLVNQQMGLT
jgi:hypothetical protein